VFILFKGEKTVVFWIGLVIFGYSIYQFSMAAWHLIYFNFIYPSLLGESSLSYPFFEQSLMQAVPGFIGGVIFLIIGLYIMRVGTVKKEESITES